MNGVESDSVGKREQGPGPAVPQWSTVAVTQDFITCPCAGRKDKLLSVLFAEHHLKT